MNYDQRLDDHMYDPEEEPVSFYFLFLFSVNLSVRETHVQNDGA